MPMTPMQIQGMVRGLLARVSALEVHCGISRSDRTGVAEVIKAGGFPGPDTDADGQPNPPQAEPDAPPPPE